ncbi:MAG TPA: heterodisulfide reductase-related iron-sulfur binding cluster, partial [Dissulfurispiraceae bacterium]|nr:heterodisulfide reductase-related iron-sulfur binding cluster [Dissulfurispiraceae bacterium]
ENQCIQEQPPKCMAACPMHVDARGMIRAVLQGNYRAGFAILHKTIPFPGIIGRICDHPCQLSCKRAEVDETVMINALERACADNSERPVRKKDFLPRKDKRVAVIGSGLSGLTAATDLATKGYKVELFEAAERLGGRIRSFDGDVLPERVIDMDLALIDDLGITVQLKSMVNSTSFESIPADFDAVYAGPGTQNTGLPLELDSDGRIKIAPITYATSHEKVFAGGGQRYHPATYSPITSMMDGRLAAVSIDRFLQGASLTASRENEGPFETRLYTGTSGIEHKPATDMEDSRNGYTTQEAETEAGRCLNCQCLECVKVCEYLAHYGSYPKRYVREIYNNDSIIMGVHKANRMVNTCALCSLCQTVCPVDLDMTEICLDARQSMVQKGKMPPSAHDFALRDMAFSNSQAFALARHQPGFHSSSTIFFPGCQLSASSPQQVAKVYEYLRQKVDGGIGLILGCCGAPADWAGEKESFDKTMAAFAATWRNMGAPKVITACSSCLRVFRNHLPNVQVESLWPLFAVTPLPETEIKKMPDSVAIHDTCAARHDAVVQDNVRFILGKLGVKVSELPANRHLSPCCSYGGLMSFANPEVADKVVGRRVGESELDYLVYCAMCRDNFAARGKRALHILDLIWTPEQVDPASRKGPGYSQRHENRSKLKTQLLKEVWGENVTGEEKGFELCISQEISTVLEKRMILVEDVQKVINHAESTGIKIKDGKTGRFIAHYKPVSVTYWVEYSHHDSGFEIHNAYSHRMQVVEVPEK